jgi:sugar lactone lactonase YvrE
MRAFSMTGARSRTHVRIATAATGWCLFVAACTNSSNSTGPKAPTGPKTPTGPTTGSLTVTISAPSGVTPSVAVSGPAGYHQILSATQTLTGLAVGSYTITAPRTASTAPIVGTVSTAVVTGSPASVTAGGTATASAIYAQQPGTGGLWATNFTDPTSLVQYTAAQLASSTSAAPAVTVTTSGPLDQSIAFDASGNLWVADYSRSEVVEYAASQLAATGSPTPAVTLSTTTGFGSLNAPSALAFDANGNLWVANGGGNTIVEFTASQLLTSGTPTQAVKLSDSSGSLVEPSALAFDPGGNLWVVNSASSGQPSVVEFGTSQLAAGGTPTSAVTLTDDGAGSLAGALALAFDPSGNLWVANGNADRDTVVEFAASQLTTSGNPTPAVTLKPSTGTANHLAGLAFDATGNLWVANSTAGTILEFTASQLLASGTPTPNTVISGLTGSWGLAFDPHATNLPIKPQRHDNSSRPHV